MDDRQLQQLIRMAMEAEQLEAGEKLRLAGTPREVRPVMAVSGRRWRGAAALAACVGLLAGVVTLPDRIVSNPPNKKMIDRAPENDDVIARALSVFKSMVSYDEEPTMVLAVFRDQSDACDCVAWQEADFGERDLHEVSRAELIAEAMKARCTPASSLVLVLALDGPRAALPETDAQARALAQCVTARDGCETNAACFATHAQECLDGNVAVVAELGPG